MCPYIEVWECCKCSVRIVTRAEGSHFVCRAPAILTRQSQPQGTLLQPTNSILADFRHWGCLICTPTETSLERHAIYIFLRNCNIFTAVISQDSIFNSTAVWRGITKNRNHDQPLSSPAYILHNITTLVPTSWGINPTVTFQQTRLTEQTRMMTSTTNPHCPLQSITSKLGIARN
jgi:hypothetical protein